MSPAAAVANWKCVNWCAEGERFELVPGHNVWDHNFASTGEKVAVKDPLYGAEYQFTVYEIEIDGRTIRFAAGEFSNGIYGFYLPGEDGA
jgi:hypothetical protein